MQISSFYTQFFVCGSLLSNYASVVSAGITENAKKSIFPTTDASRENDFVDALFAPLIEIGVVDSVTRGSYTCGVPSKYRFETNGFEIHSPYAPYHDTGGLEVETVESYYKEKWDNLMSDDNDNVDENWYYDAILDNNMAFWVMDLSTFDGYGEDLIDRVYLEWEWQDNTYYSMIVHNKLDRGDMNQYEFISDTFTGISEIDTNKLIKSEPRAVMSIDDDDDDNNNSNDNIYKQECEENGYPILEIGIRKAVSNVAANINWYKNVFSGVIKDESKQIIIGEFIDGNGNNVIYGHIFLQEDDSFQISFFQRNGIKTTYGELKINIFEEKLKLAHKQVMVNPFCCVDRWYDLHYAIPLSDDIGAIMTLENIMFNNDEIYTVFGMKKNGGENAGQGSFWTIMEPNGQMIQIRGPNSESSVAKVEFVTQPSYWDGAWCPQENTDEFQKYSFGDEIATFTIYNKGDLNINDNNIGNVKRNNILIALDVSSNSFLALFAGVGVIIILLAWAMWIGIVHFCSCTYLTPKQYKDNQVSYTYKTFY